MKMYEAAEAVLRKAGGPMHAKQIYQGIVAENLFNFGAKSPVSVLSTTLSHHSLDGRSKGKPIFERTAPGTYGLLRTTGESGAE